MKGLVVNNGKMGVSELQTLIPYETDVIRWHSLDADVTEYDFVILSSSNIYNPSLVNELNPAQEKLVSESTVPLIGLCFGYEMILKTYGATTLPLLPPEIGTYKTWPVTGAKEDGFKADYMHFFALDKLGADLQPTYKTEHAVVGVQHRTLPIAGFQFHPQKKNSDVQAEKVFLNTLGDMLS